MKTIEEHLSTYPEPIRSQALKNRKNLPFDAKTSLTRTNALTDGFNWFYSPEGSSYWSVILLKDMFGEIPIITDQAAPEPSQLDRIERKLDMLLAALPERQDQL